MPPVPAQPRLRTLAAALVLVLGVVLGSLPLGQASAATAAAGLVAGAKDPAGQHAQRHRAHRHHRHAHHRRHHHRRHHHHHHHHRRHHPKITSTTPGAGTSAGVGSAPTGSVTTTPTSTPATLTVAATPALCTTASVWQNLVACGWAGPANTGYPDGQVFRKTVTGGLVITTANTVIDGYKISGGIQVRAKGVVIRNSWITNSTGGASGTGVVNLNPGSSATITRSLLDGKGATHTCIWHEGLAMTATKNECKGVNDGIFSWATSLGKDGPGDHFDIEDNWLHAFVTSAANGHVDGYQTEGAKYGVIRHNTLDISQDQTSAIAIWNSRKSADDILVDHNLLAGGGFTVYAEDYSPSESSPAGGYSVTRVRFTNNRFSNAHYSCVGNWGVWFTRGKPTDGWSRTGNTLLETGAQLDTKNPTVGSFLCH